MSLFIYLRRAEQISFRVYSNLSWTQHLLCEWIQSQQRQDTHSFVLLYVSGSFLLHPDPIKCLKHQQLSFWAQVFKGRKNNSGFDYRNLIKLKDFFFLPVFRNCPACGGRKLVCCAIFWVSVEQMQLDFVEMLRVRDERRRMRHVETLRRQKEEEEDGEKATSGEEGVGGVALLGGQDEEEGSVFKPQPPLKPSAGISNSRTDTTTKQVSTFFYYSYIKMIYKYFILHDFYLSRASSPNQKTTWK